MNIYIIYGEYYIDDGGGCLCVCVCVCVLNRTGYTKTGVYTQPKFVLVIHGVIMMMMMIIIFVYVMQQLFSVFVYVQCVCVCMFVCMQFRFLGYECHDKKKKIEVNHFYFSFIHSFFLFFLTWKLTKRIELCE